MPAWQSNPWLIPLGSRGSAPGATGSAAQEPTAAVTFADVERAARRIAPFIHRTPVLTSATFDRMLSARLHFKGEHLQKVGAFKIRGATNAVLSLSEAEAARGVVTHSSGNHAAALALAARQRGIKARIVMPTTAPGVKVAAVRGYGGEIIFCEPTVSARTAAAEKVVAEHGSTMIHPYDHPAIVAGQGTACLELLEEVPELDLILCPIGGGGLLSGTVISAAGVRPECRVIGAEPDLADDARRSLASGQRQPVERSDTIADGLRTDVGAVPFAILKRDLAGIATVSEAAIIEATRLLLERMKQVVEPSGAVPLAAALEHPDLVRGQRVGIILSGGNVDLSTFPFPK